MHGKICKKIQNSEKHIYDHTAQFLLFIYFPCLWLNIKQAPYPAASPAIDQQLISVQLQCMSTCYRFPYYNTPTKTFVSCFIINLKASGSQNHAAYKRNRSKHCFLCSSVGLFFTTLNWHGFLQLAHLYSCVGGS